MKNNKTPGNVSITDEIVLNVLVSVWLSSYIFCLAKYLIVVVIQNIGMKVWFFSIYKSGLKEDSFNYRDITLSNCSAKFFNSTFFQRLQIKLKTRTLCRTFKPDLGRIRDEHTTSSLYSTSLKNVSRKEDIFTPTLWTWKKHTILYRGKIFRIHFSN